MGQLKTDEQTAETTIEDLKAQALAHYEEISAKACHWMSFIPMAIRAYKGNEGKQLAVLTESVKPELFLKSTTTDLIRGSGELFNSKKEVKEESQEELLKELAFDVWKSAINTTNSNRWEEGRFESYWEHNKSRFITRNK